MIRFLKKFSIFILMFVICFESMIVVASANDISTEKPVIHFATINDFTANVDHIIYEAFDRMGYDVVFDAVGMSSAIYMSSTGEMDGITCQFEGITKDNPTLVQIPVPILEVRFTAYALENNEISLESWDSLSGLRVGTLYQKGYIDSQLPEDVVNIKASSMPMLFDSLLSGACDVVVVSDTVGLDAYLPENVVNAGVLSVQDGYCYLNERYNYLVPEATKVLQLMEADGTIEKLNNGESISGSESKSILHISSYYPDMLWEKQIEKGVTEVLSQQPNISLNTVYLNAGRIQDEAARSSLCINTIRNMYMSDYPDIIIVSDNEALNFVKDYYTVMFNGVPVVYCGNNGVYEESVPEIEKYFTGTSETISADETLDLMLKLFPETQNIYVLNDYTKSGRLWQSEIEKQLNPYSDDLNIIYNQNITREDILEEVGQLPPDTLVLSGFYFVDKDGKYYSQPDMQTKLAQSTDLPIFGLFDTSIGYGQVGGKYVDGHQQAKTAAEMAMYILDQGAMPNTTPSNTTDTETYGNWIFDYNELKEANVDMEALPEGATIINEPISFYEANTTEFIVLLSIITLSIFAVVSLFIFMIILNKRNRVLIETQKSLHTMEELLIKDEEIREIKIRLEKTIESAPLIYLVTVDSIVVEANSYSKEHINIDIGSSIFDFYDTPKSREEIVAVLEKEGAYLNKIVWAKTKDGSQHRFLLNLVKIEYERKPGFIMWGIDVEESSQQKDYLADAQINLQKIIDTVTIPICIVGIDDNKIAFVNHAGLKFFEFNNIEEAIGLKMSKLTPEFMPNGESSIEAILAKLDAIINSNSSDVFEWIFSTASGREIPVSMAVSVIQYNAKQCVLVSAIDISLEKQKEDILRKAAEKEKEANQLKSRFLMNMSHEIRTPMNAIIGLSQLALRKDQIDGNFEVFQKINMSSKNLLTIINDILDFSKIEEDKLELVEDDFGLEDIIANAFMMATERIENKKIEMLLDIAQDTPYFLYGDKTRLWQVLKNLLDNAAKYTEKGRILLKVSKDATKVDDEYVWLNFVVEDTGYGMSENQLEKLFVPFEQFHNNVTNIGTGTGLGMSISKEIIKLMGGSLEVKSTLNEGTVCSINVPFKKPEKQYDMVEFINIQKTQLTHVLVIDDDVYALEIISTLLSLIDVTAWCAHTSQEAIALIKEHKNNGKTFDIVLIDYMLGEENGLEVAKTLKGILPDEVKFLMVSAYAKQLLQQERDTDSINDIIEKPFTPSVFIKKVCSTVNKQNLKPVNSFIQFENAKILIFEDNELNREVASGILELFNIVPVFAENGKIGLDILEKESFDMIFMDIMMPIMDGHEATLKIRNSDKPYKDIPIVAMSAHVMLIEKELCIQEGMNDHIGKPLDIDEVYKQITTYLPEELNQKSYKKSEEVSTIMLKKNVTLQEIEHLDYVGALARFAGKKEIYIKMLNKFLVELETQTLDLEKCLKDNDFKEIHMKVHTLKGVSGNLGVTSIFEACKAYEKTILSDNPDLQLKDKLIKACKDAQLYILPITLKEENN